MKHFMFSIVNNKIDEYEGEVSGTSPEYHHYNEKSFGIGEIYYKTEDRKVTDVIIETSDLKTAKREVAEFLSNL